MKEWVIENGRHLPRGEFPNLETRCSGPQIMIKMNFQEIIGL